MPQFAVVLGRDPQDVPYGYIVPQKQNPCAQTYDVAGDTQVLFNVGAKICDTVTVRRTDRIVADSHGPLHMIG